MIKVIRTLETFPPGADLKLVLERLKFWAIKILKRPAPVAGDYSYRRGNRIVKYGKRQIVEMIAQSPVTRPGGKG